MESTPRLKRICIVPISFFVVYVVVTLTASRYYAIQHQRAKIKVLENGKSFSDTVQ